MINERPFKVVIFSAATPAHVRQLASRIHREVPEARVCGVVYERRPGKRLPARLTAFLRNLRRWEFVAYSSRRLLQSLGARGAGVGEALLRWVHASPKLRKSNDDIGSMCEAAGIPCHLTTDFHCAESLQFVRTFEPDLGIVYGTRMLKPSIFGIPRLGSINIHKRKVPDYRGGGPVGLWELLDGEREIGITVHDVTSRLDAGSVVNRAVIPVERFDDLTSLALKAHVVGNDLLVRSVSELARGESRPEAQHGVGRLFKAPSPAQLLRHRKTLAGRRQAYRPISTRPLSKLLLKTALALPFVAVRNRIRRQRKRFPVTILFHHLVSDRPHPLAIPTAQFLRHVEFLKRFYQIVSLSEAITLLKSGEIDRPTVVLTFDDGYQENFINLRAVVEVTGIPVTLFVSTDLIARQQEFGHDLAAGRVGFRALTWEQLAIMAASGCDLGSHTRTHFDCGSEDSERLAREIAGSKRDLEAFLGRPVEYFSFPFGMPKNMSAAAMELACRHYAFVFSAFGGSNDPAKHGEFRHLKRCPHPNHPWDLALTAQSVLELQRPPKAVEFQAAADAVVEPTLDYSGAGSVPR
jgi:peptidoglycan/xylan/chitin deacetylase (PgdA/CDA1 family)